MGVIGVSKGGDLALSMSTFIPEVTAGVCINGSISNIQSRLNLYDRSIPGLDFDLGKIEIVDGAMDCYESVDDPKEYPETIIPIERAVANLLFLVSCDDTKLEIQNVCRPRRGAPQTGWQNKLYSEWIKVLEMH
ncbi:acyl-coenzyme A thioesterase 3-like [Scylla paramamosain]|uniref:acyl-coenzyme A thioesterase 3-like n=1 Tax=Scylla paramamosain TaxID=85552 RepID=UPI0030826E45